MKFEAIVNVSARKQDVRIVLYNPEPRFELRQDTEVYSITLFGTDANELARALQSMIEARNINPEEGVVNYYSTQEFQVGKTSLRRTGSVRSICWNYNQLLILPEINMLKPVVKKLQQYL